MVARVSDEIPAAPMALFTVVREPDLEWLEMALLTIIAEWRKGEHKAPKRWEIGDRA